jgi:putative ABC transport system permease protein
MRLLPTILRAARDQRPLLAALGLLVLVTSFLATAAPPMLTGRYDQALHEVIGRGPAGGPDLVFDGAVTRDHPQDGPATDARLQELSRAWPTIVPGRLLATTRPVTYDVLTPKLFVSYPPDRPQLLSAVILNWDPGVAPRVRYLSGRAPDNAPGRPHGEAGSAPPLEIALAAKAAARLQLKVGDTVHLRGGDSERPPTVRISGLYEPVSPADPFWAARPQSLLAQDVGLGRGVIAMVSTAAVDAPGFAALYRDTDVALHYAWRMPVDTGRLTAAAAPGLSADVSELRFTVHSRSRFQLVTQLDTILQSYTTQLRVTRAILALVLGGLAAVAIGVLALGCRLLLERMRTALATMRARGGSLTQLCGLACGTVGLVAAPAAAAGYALAPLAPGPSPAPSPAGALAVLGAAILVPAVVVVAAHRRPIRDERQDLTAARPAPRRLVLEGLVATLAVVATVVRRRRGRPPAPAAHGTDPFVAAVPILLALAVGLLLLRGYPYPLRAIGRIVRRGRSAVSFLGVALASRQRLVAVLPMVVLLLATAVTGFAATINAGVSRAQASSAWHAVGADALVSASVMDPAAVTRVEHVQGVEGAIPARIFDGAQVTSAGAPAETLSVVAVDLDAYRRITRGRPVQVPPGPRGGGRGVPALFSATLAHMAAAKGMTLAWDGGPELPIHWAGTIDDFPMRPAGTGFVVIPYTALNQANAEPNTIFVRGDHLDTERLRHAAIADNSVESDVSAETFARLYGELAGAPLVGVLHDTFGYAALTVGGYGTLAILLALVTGATARGRTVSYLRTLGLSRRQAHRLALVELGPVILCAAVAGWAMGLVLPHVVGPAVDLRAYTGGFPASDFTLDPMSTALLAAGLLASTGLALAIDIVVNTRGQPTSALRMGDQP